MAVAKVDATQVDAMQYTLKPYNLLPGQKEWIKRVLGWNKKEGYKFLYYGDEDHKFVIKVKSLKPYDKLKMTCAEMIDLLNKEVTESDRLIVKTSMSNLETGAPHTNEKTMMELTNDIHTSLPALLKIYLHSDSGKIIHFKVEDKAKIAAPPKTKTADSPFRPRRKLSKRLKKSFSKSAQKRRKSKKRSAKPRRR